MDRTLFAPGGANQVELTSGRKVQLPVRYLDWTGIVAHFPAREAAIRKLLPTTKLAPVRIAPGIAILTLAAIEYRRVADLAPYNEVAFMTPVLYEPMFNVPAAPLFFPSRFDNFGFFVIRMAVTSQDVLELGESVWGYSKFLAGIEFGESGNLRRCRVRADGRGLLALGVEQGPAAFRRVDYKLYTAKDGQLLRHRLETEGLYARPIIPGGAAAAFGDHPLGLELQALCLRKTAVARVFASNMSSLLHEPDWTGPL